MEHPMARPTALTVAAALLAVEGLGVVVLALLDLVDLTSGRVTMAVTTALFLGAYGVGLLLCAWGLARCRSWARGPAVLAQLIQLGLAWSFRGTAATVSVVLAVVSIAALVAVFSRRSLEALETGGQSGG